MVQSPQVTMTIEDAPSHSLLMQTTLRHFLKMETPLVFSYVAQMHRLERVEHDRGQYFLQSGIAFLILLKWRNECEDVLLIDRQNGAEVSAHGAIPLDGMIQ
jgi:hypothetical protein